MAQRTVLPVLAVVDGAGASTVVWWVNLGRSETARLCGAWVHPDVSLLPHLIENRLLLATRRGAEKVAESTATPGPRLDPRGTLGAVEAEIALLQAAYDHRAATSRQLIAPTWPTLPHPLDVESPPPVSSGDPRAARALSISRWFDRLCRSWDAVESERVTRKYLHDMRGNVPRELPLVTREATE